MRPQDSSRILHDPSRRAFVGALATTGAALVVGACSGGVGESGSERGASSAAGAGGPSGPGTGGPSGPGTGGTGGPGTGGTGGAPGNQAPVWQKVPTIQFTEGVAAEISIAAYLSDPDGD